MLSIRKNASPVVMFGLFFNKKLLSNLSVKYNMPKVCLNDYLHHSHKFDRNLMFTILNPKYIYQSISELQQQFKQVGTMDWDDKEFRFIDTLVTFTPERQIKHWVAILVSVLLKIENGKHFLKVCHELEKKVSPLILKENDYFKKIYNNSQQQALNAVNDFYNQNHSDYYYEIKKLFNAINKRNYTNNNFNKSSINKIVSDIIGNDIYQKEMRNYLIKNIQEIIKNEIKLDNYQALPTYKPQNRITQMIIGAPATGKSFLMRQSMHYLTKDQTIDATEFANISPDRYRLVLLDDDSLGDDRRIHGSLTHHEARYMAGEAVKLIEHLAHKNSAPHVFIEQMNIYDDEVLHGTFKNARLRVNITCYPPEKALTGNIERFNDKNHRLVPADIILNAFKTVSQTLPKMLATHQGKDIIFSLYDTYRMVKENVSYQEAFIAEFNCKTKTIKVQNFNSLLDFIKNIYINTKYINSEQMYDKTILLQTIKADFMRQYKDYKLEIISAQNQDNIVDQKNMFRMSPD